VEQSGVVGWSNCNIMYLIANENSNENPLWNRIPLRIKYFTLHRQPYAVSLRLLSLIGIRLLNADSLKGATSKIDSALLVIVFTERPITSPPRLRHRPPSSALPPMDSLKVRSYTLSRREPCMTSGLS
jgi:hypothetical protein